MEMLLIFYISNPLVSFPKFIFGSPSEITYYQFVWYNKIICDIGIKLKSNIIFLSYSADYLVNVTQESKSKGSNRINLIYVDYSKLKESHVMLINAFQMIRKKNREVASRKIWVVSKMCVINSAIQLG